MTSPYSLLHQNFADRSGRICVIGAGQIGLLVALGFVEAGFLVMVHDESAVRIEQLRAGRSPIADVSDETLSRAAASGRFTTTSDPTQVSNCDAIIVCVPTPLGKSREPDMSHVTRACSEIAKHLQTPALVVIESTTYPGATDEILVPLLLEPGRTLGKDLFVAFSPERIDPGNRTHGLRNTPKVISGMTPDCLDLVETLYRHVVAELVTVSSTRTAETVKLLENTFRAVNIALVNEMALVARRLDVDPFEVIRAASTKPFGYMPFFPGPGLGGHCIPVDPIYLSWKMRTLNYEPRLIAMADAINSAMPRYVVLRLVQLLNEIQKDLPSAHVLLYGVAYKRDVSDTRESPSIEIFDALAQMGARVDYVDPCVPECEVAGVVHKSMAADVSFDAFDAVIICTDHSSLPRARMIREAHLILDTRDALAGAHRTEDHVHLL